MLESNHIDSVMIVSPHGDDEVLGAGGLIAKCSDKGIPVRVLFLAVDASRHYGLDGSTTLEQRLTEIDAAASLLNYDFEIAYSGEGKLERLDTVPLRDLVDLIEQTINSWRPDLLLLPHGNDYDQDHVACFRAAHAAARPIPENCGKYLVKKVATYEMPKLEWATVPFRPSLYWNITGEFRKKEEAIRLYETQLRQSPHTRSIENMKALANLRGSEIGARYAEAFNVLRWVV